MSRIGSWGSSQPLKSDNVFRDLVLARIIEPCSKIDAERVLSEVGVHAASYATVKRRLRGYAQKGWRSSLAAACAAHAGLGPASLVLFDVSTLYFETDTGDGFREPGFSKERRLEPQITLGLLTDAAGFPLTVQAFEGNKAETATMLPVINAFKAAHHLSDVTVVADAGMISEANQIALQAAGLSFILGTRIPQLPDLVRRWRDTHPDQAIPDGLTLTQPWPSSSSEKARGIPDRVIHYQYRHDRARRTLRGIDEQVRKAERAVDGHAPVKRNRYIQLSGATKTVNRTLETKTRALAGWKGYTTNLVDQSATFVIDAYHQLWHIEKAFRMSKHDLQARPVYHHLRESIEAHLSIVVTAMAVSHYIEHQTGWSIKKFVRTARRYRTSRSKPADKSSPPPTRYPTICAKPSPRSAVNLNTRMSQLGTPPGSRAGGLPATPFPARCPARRAVPAPSALQRPSPRGCIDAPWASQTTVPSAYLHPRFQGQEPPGFPGRFNPPY